MRGEAREVVASAARTTTGTSGAIAARAGASTVAIMVITTAASGTTPSMTLSLEWSNDGGTTWAVGDPADSMTAITGTANGLLAKSFTVKAVAYRVRWTISGTTPSFTFKVLDFAA